MSSLVYFIGYNSNGEFGLNHCDTLHELTPCSNKSITKIFSSNKYCIYSNDDFQQIYAAGNNTLGQCGVGIADGPVTTLKPIEYFNENDINIKIFILKLMMID